MCHTTSNFSVLYHRESKFNFCIYRKSPHNNAKIFSTPNSTSWTINLDLGRAGSAGVTVQQVGGAPQNRGPKDNCRGARGCAEGAPDAAAAGRPWPWRWRRPRRQGRWRRRHGAAGDGSVQRALTGGTDRNVRVLIPIPCHCHALHHSYSMQALPLTNHRCNDCILCRDPSDAW